MVVIGWQKAFVFKVFKGCSEIRCFEIRSYHRKPLFLDPMQVHRAFCGKEPSEWEVRASAELLRAL